MTTRTHPCKAFHPLLAAAVLLVAGAGPAAGGVGKINDGMPNRLSMNVTVARQTQGATFGEKVRAGKIDVVLTPEGCVVLFAPDAGYRVDVATSSIGPLSAAEATAFGEKVNQGLHAAGGALAQGASPLGGALPGGAIISAAVSSVGTLAGGPRGGASAASYAATGRQAAPAESGKRLWTMEGRDGDADLDLADGEYELAFLISHKATSGLKDTLKTQVRIGFQVAGAQLKSRHDTAKNSVGNIR